MSDLFLTCSERPSPKLRNHVTAQGTSAVVRTKYEHTHGHSIHGGRQAGHSGHLGQNSPSSKLFLKKSALCCCLQFLLLLSGSRHCSVRSFRCNQIPSLNQKIKTVTTRKTTSLVVAITVKAWRQRRWRPPAAPAMLRAAPAAPAHSTQHGDQPRRKPTVHQCLLQSVT